MEQAVPVSAAAKSASFSGSLNLQVPDPDSTSGTDQTSSFDQMLNDTAPHSSSPNIASQIGNGAASATSALTLPQAGPPNASSVNAAASSALAANPASVLAGNQISNPQGVDRQQVLSSTAAQSAVTANVSVPWRVAFNPIFDPGTEGSNVDAPRTQVGPSPSGQGRASTGGLAPWLYSFNNLCDVGAQFCAHEANGQDAQGGTAQGTGTNSSFSFSVTALADPGPQVSAADVGSIQDGSSAENPSSSNNGAVASSSSLGVGARAGSGLQVWNANASGASIRDSNLQGQSAIAQIHESKTQPGDSLNALVPSMASTNASALQTAGASEGAANAQSQDIASRPGAMPIAAFLQNAQIVEGQVANTSQSESGSSTSTLSQPQAPSAGDDQAGLSCESSFGESATDQSQTVSPSSALPTASAQTEPSLGASQTTSTRDVASALMGLAVESGLNESIGKGTQTKSSGEDVSAGSDSERAKKETGKDKQAKPAAANVQTTTDSSQLGILTALATAQPVSAGTAIQTQQGSNADPSNVNPDGSNSAATAPALLHWHEQVQDTASSQANSGTAVAGSTNQAFALQSPQGPGTSTDTASSAPQPACASTQPESANPTPSNAAQLPAPAAPGSPSVSAIAQSLVPGPPAQPSTHAGALSQGLATGQLNLAPQSDGPLPNFNAMAVDIATKTQDGIKQFHIQMDPADLGRVEVRLSIDASGKAQAHLSADQPQTLQLLQKDAPALTRALRDAGLNFSQSGLNFSLKGQDRHNSGGGAQRSSRSASISVQASKSISATQASTGYRASLDGRLDIRV